MKKIVLASLLVTGLFAVDNSKKCNTAEAGFVENSTKMGKARARGSLTMYKYMKDTIKYIDMIKRDCVIPKEADDYINGVKKDLTKALKQNGQLK